MVTGCNEPCNGYSVWKEKSVTQYLSECLVKEILIKDIQAYSMYMHVVGVFRRCSTTCSCFILNRKQCNNLT